MLPKKYKAMSVYGKEVEGYVAPIVVDMKRSNGEVGFVWGIYTEDCIEGRVLYRDNEKESYKVNSVPIYIDTLQEIAE